MSITRFIILNYIKKRYKNLILAFTTLPYSLLDSREKNYFPCLIASTWKKNLEKENLNLVARTNYSDKVHGLWLLSTTRFFRAILKTIASFVTLEQPSGGLKFLLMCIHFVVVLLCYDYHFWWVRGRKHCWNIFGYVNNFNIVPISLLLPIMNLDCNTFVYCFVLVCKLCF